MKRVGVIVVGVIIICTMTIGCNSTTSFTEVGVFKAVQSEEADEIEGRSYCVQNPTKSEIENFCEKESNKFSKDSKHRDVLWLEFSDSLEHTPKYEKGFVGMKQGDSSFVANYVYHPGNPALTEHNFFKEIPE